MLNAHKVAWPGLGVIASVGFFALAAQTLLFRVFLTVFEGNELGIACFFSSWLLWVVVGAVVARLWLERKHARFLGDRFEFLPLLYLPAYLLQEWLLGHARELAGVRPYELFPLLTLLPVAFLANAPVSFCTGFLFTLACRWVRTPDGSPVARVYTWESVGGVLGGLAVTLLLARGMAEETLFLYTALLLTGMHALYRLRQSAERIGAIVPPLPPGGTPLRRGKHSPCRAWRGLRPSDCLFPPANHGRTECDPPEPVPVGRDPDESGSDVPPSVHGRTECAPPGLTTLFCLGAVLPVLAVVAALLLGVGDRWERHNNLRTWQRILPAQACQGRFTTPEAKYLYGEYGDQFNVVAWETVADTIPATEHASEIVALHLAQRPAARRFLVAGRGAFSICRRLLDLPQTEAITWFDPDPAYPSRLLSRLPERFRPGVERLEMPGDDIRRWLSRTRRQYDAIILDYPDATTLALNRYFTREFFQLLKAHLSEPGVLGVRISAGENVMSEDRVNAGASVYATLRSVFRRLVIKPGDESWLLVSDSPGLIATPAALRDRFAAIPGADRLYPPDGLMALYLPQRIEYMRQRYEAAVQSAPNDLLLNTDRSPRALLHGLLFAAHEAGGGARRGGLGRGIRTLALHGSLILPIGLLLFPLLRILFLRRGRGVQSAVSPGRDAVPASVRLFPLGIRGHTECDPPEFTREGPRRVGVRFSPFDSYTLVFTTGAAGMGSTIALMYLYQSAFGSIFLYMGLISALFMLGLAVGSAVTARLLADGARPAATGSGLLCLVLLAHVLLCGVILFLAEGPTHAGFAAAFVLSGLLGGVYLPLAACRLTAAGAPPASAGAWLEAADHLGGAVGGLITGLILLPVFGTPYSLLVLALLLVTNIAALMIWPVKWRARLCRAVGGFAVSPRHPAAGQVASWLPTWRLGAASPSMKSSRGDEADRFRERTRSIGYVLFGLTVFALAAGLLLRHRDDGKAAFLAFARSAAGTNELQVRQQIFDDGKTLEYFHVARVDAGGERTGEKYIFRTGMLASDIVGYGGRIELAVVVETDGTLQDVRVLRSDETPSYLDFLEPWLQRLPGGKLFVPEPLKDVDAVTGATLTSSAILRILRKAGPDFAGKALGLAVSPTPSGAPNPTPYRETLWLVLALAAALVLRARPSRLWRRGFLILVLALSGFVFNMQYSLAHVFSLLALAIPPVGWGTAFPLVVGIPLLVALFGNIYCGYLCPFGALQELAGDLRPASLRADATLRSTSPDKTAWAYGRFVKYLLLALMTLLFATTLSAAAGALASNDPLVTVFAYAAADRRLLFLAALLVGLAFFYPRFWCRTLCPTGAFLSLLNGVRLLRRPAPSIVPAACVYGVRENRDLDCLCCDRCRQPGPQEQRALSRPPGWVAARSVNTALLAIAVALALMLAVRTVAAWRVVLTGAGSRGRAEMVGRGARPVDMKRLRTLIEQGRLSDREGRFYKPVTGGPPGVRRADGSSSAAPED